MNASTTIAADQIARRNLTASQAAAAGGVKKKVVRNLVRVRTPWCSADLLVPYFTVPLAQRLVTLNTGRCPSGVTFNSANFWRELKAARPGWVTQSLGKVANLPWGRVNETMAFYPPNRRQK